MKGQPIQIGLPSIEREREREREVDIRLKQSCEEDHETNRFGDVMKKGRNAEKKK